MFILQYSLVQCNHHNCNRYYGYYVLPVDSNVEQYVIQCTVLGPPGIFCTLLGPLSTWYKYAVFVDHVFQGTGVLDTGVLQYRSTSHM